MTKLSYKKTVTKVIEREVPDYYGCDDTKLGRAVDYLLKDYEHRGRSIRDRIYDHEEGNNVESCLDQLERAYETARGVAYALGVTSCGAETAKAKTAVPYAVQLERLSKRVQFILAQDQGCGGNLSEKEIVEAMEREIITLAQEITV